MFLHSATHFLINAHIVTPMLDNQINKNQPQFEFVFNEKLQLLESMRLVLATSVNNYKIEAIKDLSSIYRILFELNHVRVNPKLDNHEIINILTNALNKVGIRVNNPPTNSSLAICFQPLGEIIDNVRFYLKENDEIVFLSKRKPKLNVIY